MITENINFRGAGKLPVHGVIWIPDDKRVEQVLHVIHAKFMAIIRIPL